MQKLILSHDIKEAWNESGDGSWLGEFSSDDTEIGQLELTLNEKAVAIRTCEFLCFLPGKGYGTEILARGLLFAKDLATATKTPIQTVYKYREGPYTGRLADKTEETDASYNRIFEKLGFKQTDPRRKNHRCSMQAQLIDAQQILNQKWTQYFYHERTQKINPPDDISIDWAYANQVLRQNIAESRKKALPQMPHSYPQLSDLPIIG